MLAALVSVPDNYTFRDLVGSALSCLLFIPILLAPGYVVAWFTEVFGFRGLTPPWKVLVSLPLSVAICPILTYWAGLGGSWIPVFALYGFCFAIWLSLLAGLWGHDRFPRWLGGFRAVPRAGWVIPGVWFAVGILSLVNLQLGNRLYLSFSDYDHELRAAITDAISRNGVRPFNPFYLIGAPAALRYHYFWFLLCSIVSQAGGALVSSQQAIIAGAVWCGWSLIALVPLYLRFFGERTGTMLRRTSLVAIGLFTITGLDIVPTALYALIRPPFPEMEWWNEQVTSWFGSLLWVPHHVAALVAGVTGFLLAWDAGQSASPRRRITGGMLAGVAFATAAGTSIYVTLVFAVFLTLWTFVTLFRRWWRPAAVLIMAGVVAAVLVEPYFRSLAGPGSGGAFVLVSVRRFTPLEIFTQAMALNSVSRSVLRILALPLNYFLELGFFGVAAIVFLRGLRRQPAVPPNVLAAVMLAAVSVGICTFLKSGVIGNNDLGWRGFLPAQFIMLLWGADLMVSRGGIAIAGGRGLHNWWLRSPLWAPLIVLGAAGTLYELALSRTYFLWSDAGSVPPTTFAPDRQFGARALELRRAYETLDRILPRTANLQSSPEWHSFNFYSGLYSNRQTVVADPVCGTDFGGDPALCPYAFASIGAIFDAAPNATWDGVVDVCRRFSIDALILTDLDAAWRDEAGWVREAAPLLSGRHVRVYLVDSPAPAASR